LHDQFRPAIDGQNDRVARLYRLYA
jgi:hypothetical protein